MSHVPEETLAGLALGETDALRPQQRWHLTWCRSCAGELAGLRGVVETGRGGPPYPLRPPRPGLLAAIEAELERDGADGTEEPAPLPSARGPVPARRSPDRPTRSPRVRWIAAAVAAAVVVGISATVVYRQSDDDVVATAVLAPLPTKSGSGRAQMISGRDGQELAVSVDSAPPPDRFEEVWLFSSDGKGMISVGILPPNGRATFPVPSAPGALAGYTVVDVSLEPYDGDPAHSHNSVLRGTLT